MKIYGFATFNVSKCTLVADFAGVPYEYVNLDPLKGEHKTPEHRARHPLGMVPVLETDDGQCLFESGAIARYLGRVADSDLYQGDAAELARIDGWIDLVNIHIGRWLTVFFFQEVLMHSVNGRDVDEAALAEAQQWLDKQLPAMDGQLAETPYLAGERISIADPFAAALIQIHEVTRFDLSPYENIQRWYEGLRSQPAYAASMSHFPNNQLWQ